MKVKELIKELQEVPNQNARVELCIPEEIEGSGCDIVRKDFDVHWSHAINEHEDDLEPCKKDRFYFNENVGIQWGLHGQLDLEDLINEKEGS